LSDVVVVEWAENAADGGPTGDLCGNDVDEGGGADEEVASGGGAPTDMAPKRRTSLASSVSNAAAACGDNDANDD
jgi:hypothetical protein